MAKYQVQTDQGSYEVETDETPLTSDNSAMPVLGNFLDEAGKNFIDPVVALFQHPAQVAPQMLNPMNYIRGVAGNVNNLMAETAPTPAGQAKQPVNYGKDVADVLGLATLKAPEWASEVHDMVPSFSGAASDIQRVTDAVGSMPIDLSGSLSKTALRIKDLATRGNRMPKVVNDFLTRATAPGKAPMSFSEARDFYSSATRLSGDEFNKMTPTMRRSLGDFVGALHDSLVDVADRQGLGDTYDSAIQEYRKAAQVRDFTSNVKDLVKRRALPAAAGALGAGLGYSLYKDFTR